MADSGSIFAHPCPADNETEKKKRENRIEKPRSKSSKPPSLPPGLVEVLRRGLAAGGRRRHESTRLHRNDRTQHGTERAPARPRPLLRGSGFFTSVRGPREHPTLTFRSGVARMTGRPDQRRPPFVATNACWWARWAPRRPELGPASGEAARPASTSTHALLLASSKLGHQYRSGRLTRSQVPRPRLESPLAHLSCRYSREPEPRAPQHRRRTTRRELTLPCWTGLDRLEPSPGRLVVWSFGTPQRGLLCIGKGSDR